MKTSPKLLLTLALFLFIGSYSFAQGNNQANDLIKQGVDLHNAGKYDQAIAKFNEALKADPANGYANYELAFSLYASKKPNDAIPYLEKAAKSASTSLIVPAYALLATIYDEGQQPQKAIETYNAAIKINQAYPQIYYNLGIAYFRNQQYAEAENSAIEAIKHDPKNASSQRLYALVCFHQNKRANALLGFCSFLLIEPTGPRAAEAFSNIQHIIQGGVLKDNNGNTSINVSPKDDKETGTLNLGISLTVASSQSKKLAGNDLLEYELKSIFALTGQLAEKKTDKTFFDKFFADYLYKLAQSPNMPAFTKMVAEHTPLTGELDSWVKNTERGF
jgi:tetratricopeptide (TPR) repeat protein